MKTIKFNGDQETLKEYQKPDERPIDRRKFFQYFSSLGLGVTMMPALGSKSLKNPKTQRITVEDMAKAEKLFDIEFTKEEREKIVDDVNQNILYYRDIRKKNLGNNVNLSLVYNPLLPNMILPQDKKPIRYSKLVLKQPSKIEDVCYCSVLQLAYLLRTRKISSTELTRMYLSRLKKYNPLLKFVITFTEDLAIKQAQKADKEIQAGDYKGPLHGIPYGVKDLFAVEGYRTTWGAEPFRNQIITPTATVVQKLQQAGAVLLAKLSMGQLASGDTWFGGKTKSPWDPTRGAGGSSAGPASATAAGSVGFALGTETNGSIITPSFINGVTGFRPTFGRISRSGTMMLSWSLDKVGVISRSVEDCAVVFDAIYGPDGKDNSVVDLPFNWDSDLDISKLRIGYFTKSFKRELMDADSDPKEIAYNNRLRELSRNVLSFFRNRGFKLIPLDFDIPIGGADMILEIEAAAAFDELTRSNQDDQLKDSYWPNAFRRVRYWSAVEYIQANRYRTIMNEKFHEAIKDVDVYLEVTWANNWLTNMTGHPSVVVPCGFIKKNQPAGITFVGHLYREAELLAVAKYFQDATRHHLQHPTL